MKSLCAVVLAGLAVVGCDTDRVDSNGELDDDALRHAFIPNPDVGGGTESPCDLFLQDCPAGDKCMPWANDGGSAWNATRCSPVVPEPGTPGQPCTVDGSGVSGVDDCERGAMCFFVDPDTNQGTCVELLVGSTANPLCSDPFDTPVLSSVLGLCLSQCRPLQSDCPAGQGCYPSGDTFACVADASGDGGAFGDGCEFPNACEPGLACVAADAVAGCDDGVLGCCTPYCDTSAPSCPAATTCQPWFEDVTPLPGGENLGVCID